ncbi:MAG: exonuclease subunit SbcD [Bacteroidota bacterium]
MKLLHTADWHLGKRLERFDRSAEQVAILGEICEIAEREAVDAVLIAGDLYDTYNPPIEATDNFYRHLKRLSDNGRRAVIAIAGNHDSPHRIEAPDPLARECGILFAGYPNSQIQPFALDTGLAVVQSAPGFIELQLPNCDCPLRLLLTPYANENRMRRTLPLEGPVPDMQTSLQQHWQQLADRFCDEKGVNMLMAHLFMLGRGDTPPEEPEDEKPINIGGANAVFTDIVPAAMQYVALGHLHRHQNMKGGPCPCVYASSPLEYSFAEAGQDKYVVLLDCEPGQPVTYRKEKLHKGRSLHRAEFEDLDEAVTWLEAHPEAFVELHVLTDTYIRSVDRKRLTNAHPRIIGPIPKPLNPDLVTGIEMSTVDPARSREALFEDFFRHKKGVAPGDEMQALFLEIIGKEEAT